MLSTRGFSHVYLIFLLLPLSFITTIYGQNVSVTIPLNKSLTWANKELYGGFLNVNRTSTLEIKLAEPDKSLSFIIFQVHIHLYNVTLYKNTLTRQSAVVGKNIGMYSSVKPALDTFYVYNQNDVDVKIYVTVHGYDEIDPIPGGCNMEFPTPIAPYIRTIANKDFILVDLAAPSDSKDLSCKFPEDITVVFYKMYLPEKHSTYPDIYFHAIQSMLTLDKISDNGGFIPDNGEHMRRRHAAYHGMGVVYVAVAYSNTNKSAYSVYVPNVVYNCNPLEEGDCKRLHDALGIIMCICLIVIGCGLCFFGHYFFKTEMFLVGTLSGAVVTYIIISLIAVVDPTALLGVSLLSGVGFGAIWLLFWWFYGMPLFSVFLPTLNVGFLFAAIIYYALPGGVGALQLDLNFWTLFIAITLLTSLMLVSMTFLSNILCCAILGAYSLVFAMGYVVGTNMNYIIINTVRRAVVPMFNKVILAPPFAWQEMCEISMWILMAICGFLAQHLMNRRRPPFPPPPRSVRPSMPGLSYGAIDQENRRLRNEPTASRKPSSVSNETAPLLA